MTNQNPNNLNGTLTAGLTMCWRVQRAAPPDITKDLLEAWFWAFDCHELTPADVKQAFRWHLESSAFFPAPAEIIRLAYDAAMERIDAARPVCRALVTEEDSSRLKEPTEETRRRLNQLFGLSEEFGQLECPGPRVSEPTKVSNIIGEKNI